MPLLLVDTSLVSKVYLGIKMFLAKLRKVIVGINKHYWGREGDICKELILIWKRIIATENQMISILDKLFACLSSAF